MNEIIGQSRAIDTLTAAMTSGRMHHAWIFHGPMGVGKFTTALALSHILLCPEAAPDLTGQLAACGQCRACTMLASSGGPETHPDLHIIRKEAAADSAFRTLKDRKQTNIPVDLLRELMIGGSIGSGDSAKYVEPIVSHSPVMNHAKIFIIDEAELLASAGQNILLKTLEEPPPRTFIFLVTTEEDRLLPTIRSRSQRVSFVPLGEEDVGAFIDRYCRETISRIDQQIVEMESGKLNKTEEKQLAALRDQRLTLELTPEQVGAVLRFAQGSLGRAQLAIDYALHHWQIELQPLIREMAAGRQPRLLGPTIVQLVEDFATRYADRDARASKDAANKASVRHMLSLLSENCRHAITHYTSTMPVDDPAAIEQRVWPYLHGIDLMQDAERQLGSNVSPALLLDNLAVQWMLSFAPAHSGR